MITAELGGVWVPVWQDFELDDAQAVRMGHVNDVGTAAPHGTYAPIECLRVQTTDDGAVENAIIDVYDGNACFCRFRWDEASDRWNSSNEPLTFSLPAGSYPSGGNDKPFVLPELTLVRHPTLTLAQYTPPSSPGTNGKSQESVVYHTTSLGDPSTAVDLPAQSLEYDGDESKLTWKIQPWTSSDPVLVIRLGLPPLDPQRTIEGHNLGQKFGLAFVVQSHLDQVSSSFCGYNPASTGGYASAELYSATRTGTPQQSYPTDNPQQSFNGALLFGFPRYDSYDYVQCTNLEGSPNVPAGIWPEAVDTETDATHSEFVSSTSDEAQAWSVSLGLSAGLGKILSDSGSLEYSAKTETQKKNESRFTVSRKITKVWASHLDPTVLVLHNTYMAAIRSRALHLLSDTTSDKSQTVPWAADFVPSYGTHYANTITHGSLDIGETWFTLQNEMIAQQNSMKFSDKASAALDGAIKGGTSLSEEWSSKESTGLTVSDEDTLHLTIGTPDRVGILLDLRPASELMSPIFVPYDPDDAWGKFAPWVWTTVRADFEDWLTKYGLNQPIDADLIASYTPRRFTVSVQSVYVAGGARPTTAFERPQGNFNATGSISLSAVAPPQSATPATTVDPSQSTIDPTESIVYASRPGGFPGVNVHPQSYAPGAECSIATTAGNIAAGPAGGLCVELAFDITITEVVSDWTAGGAESTGLWTDSVETRAEWKNSGMRVDLPFATLPNGQTQAPTHTVSIPQGIYTLQITIAATDAGAFLS